MAGNAQRHGVSGSKNEGWTFQGSLDVNKVDFNLQTVAAAGASQGDAGAISASYHVVVVTVTASTQGVKLPTAVAGLAITVLADPSVGVNVYPYSGDAIGAGSTNAAHALAANKAATYIAVDATNWRVLRGA